jgi:hypothetical protein
LGNRSGGFDFFARGEYEKVCSGEVIWIGKELGGELWADACLVSKGDGDARPEGRTFLRNFGQF